MGKHVTKSEHTRRQFLRSAAAAAGIGVAGMAATGGTRAVATVLAEADVFEARLDDPRYTQYVKKYTTPWGQVVDDWRGAFLVAANDLKGHGGGRLIVPGDSAGTRTYHISNPVVFDLPSVSVHLNAGAYVERVGVWSEWSYWMGAPLCFHGNIGASTRTQQNFAALLGPGKVGYPAARVNEFPHENGVGVSYYKTVVVDGVHVPFAPGKGLTAQFGCNSVTFRNNRIGPTSQRAEEQSRGGQAAITVQGGLNPPAYPLFTDAVITNNVVELGGLPVGSAAVRGIYVDMCENVEIGGNRFAPVARGGITVAACGRASLHDNVLAQVSRGSHGAYNALDIVGVDDPDVLRNTVQDTTHKHCVYSAYREGHGGVIYARDNHWTRGYGSIFAGSPMWDSD